MADDDLAALREQNALLTSQLAFARQKASLYYITASELDSLKSNKIVLTANTLSVSTQTVYIDIVEVGSQTQTSSESVEQEMHANRMKDELDELRARLSRVERVKKKDVSTIPPPALVIEYSELFDEYLRSCQMSVNHSLEIHRRDGMIGSLLEKMKLMETAFSEKLKHSQSVAESRKEVINELGDQVKIAMRLGNQEQGAITWQEMAAMHSELEDMRAELSKARSNWAATRDELVRLQFNHDGTSSSTQPPGMISAIRKVLLP